MARSGHRSIIAGLVAVVTASVGVAGGGSAQADIVFDGDPIVIAEGGTRFAWPAYNTSNGESLVFWNDVSDQQYARVLGTDGQPKPGTSPVLITDGYFSNDLVNTGAAIYNPVANNYMLLTSQRFLLPGSRLRSEVIAQVVNADGTLGPRTTVISEPGNSSLMGPSDMAYDPVNNRFMIIAWGTFESTPRLNGYRAVVIDAAGNPVSPVVSGSQGYIVQPQVASVDVHALAFDPVSQSYLFVHAEYGPNGVNEGSVNESWLEVERFSSTGARLSEVVLEPVLAPGYQNIFLAAHPTKGQYLLTYADPGSDRDGVSPRNIQYTQLLASDGTKIGPRHNVGTTANDDFDGGPVYDASTDGWMLFRGNEATVQLDPLGRPICLPVSSVMDDRGAVAAGPGRFLITGSTSSGPGVQWVKSVESTTSAFRPAPEPFRGFDSRPSEPTPGPKGTVGPNGSVKIQIRGVGSVPDSASVSAVVVNLTVVGSAPSFASAYASGSIATGETPPFSNVNIIQPGQVRANMAIVPVGDDGKIEVFALAASEIIVDVTGWFEQVPCASAAGRFEPLAVARVFDTRASEPAPGPKGRIGAGQKVTVQIAGVGGVPASGVSAVSLSVVATNTGNPGYVTVAPTISGTPATSLININAAGETAPNAIITPLSPSGTVDVFALDGADVAIDVSGYFTDGTAEEIYDGLYVPIQPSRVFDARPESTDPGPKGVMRNSERSVVGVGVGGIPQDGVSAIAVNVGAVSAELPGFITAWDGIGDRPTASVLNFAGNDVRSATAITPLSPTGRFDLYVLNSATPFADVSGYFTKTG